METIGHGPNVTPRMSCHRVEEMEKTSIKGDNMR